jgi:ribonuclease P protein component
VPKLQVPLAVDRNRIKRVVREFFRLYQKKIPSGIYLVRWVLPKKGLKNVSSKYLIRGLALNRELLVLFESINQSQSSESAHV